VVFRPRTIFQFRTTRDSTIRGDPGEGHLDDRATGDAADVGRDPENGCVLAQRLQGLGTLELAARTKIGGVK
jgi:hypothetical protein